MLKCRYLVLAGGVVALSGCLDPGGSGSGRIDVEDLAQVSVSEELRIGSLEDPTKGFSRISDVLVTPDGSVLVLEGADAEIRKYDTEGRLTRTFGGEGSGPGELSRPGSFGVVNDTLWVSDSGNNRITLFTLDGELAGTLPRRAVQVPVAVKNIRVSVSPHAYLGKGLFTSSYRMSFFGETTGGPDSVRIPSLIFNMDGAVVDTVDWRLERMSVDFVSRGGSVIILRNPLRDSPLRDEIDGDQVVIERSVASTEASGVFRVTRLSSVGDTVFAREFKYRPRAVSGSFLDSLVESHIDNLPSSWDRSGWESAVREALPGIEYHPPVTEHWIAEDKSVWLRLNRAEGDNLSWVVVGPDGTLRGIVSLPGSAEIEWSEGDKLWTVERDELDVPWLVRYRLAGS